jgi:hypothetical protein
MKDSDKVTLSIGQIKRLIKETNAAYKVSLLDYKGNTIGTWVDELPSIDDLLHHAIKNETNYMVIDLSDALKGKITVYPKWEI